MALTAQMWLTFSPEDDEAIEAFCKERWTPTLQKSWSSFPVIATNYDDMADELNTKIQKDCKTIIEKDIGSSISSVDAFQGSGWTVGGSGTHSGSNTVSGIKTPGGLSALWKFVVNGKPYTISASVNMV